MAAAIVEKVFINLIGENEKVVMFRELRDDSSSARENTFPEGLPGVFTTMALVSGSYRSFEVSFIKRPLGWIGADKAGNNFDG